MSSPTEPPNASDGSALGPQTSAWPYALGAIGGGISVLISPSLWLVPVIVMFGYLGYGHRIARRQGTILEFADSFYYLGFTFTIASLLGSLKPFSRASIEPRDVLYSFGLGLFTTLIGVIGRTVMQMSYQTPNERLEATNRRIEAEASEYLNNLTAINSRSSRILAETLTGLENQLAEQLGACRDQIARFSDSLKRALLDVGNLRVDATGLETSVTDLAQSLKAGEAAIRGHMQELGTAHQELQRSVQATARSGLSAHAQLHATITQETAKLSTALTSLQARVASVDVDPRTLQLSLERAASSINESVAPLSAQLSSITAIAQPFGAELAQLRTRLTSIDLAPLQAAVASVAGQIREVGTTIARQSHSLTVDSLTSLHSILQETTKQAQQLNALLDEIAEAVRVKLRQF